MEGKRTFSVAAVGMLGNYRAESLSEAQSKRLFDQMADSGMWLYVAWIEDGDNLVNSWRSKGAF